MSLKRTVLSGLTAMLAISAAAVAGPLELNRVPADTVFVMHVDIEQVRSTTLGRVLMDEDCGLDLDEMREELSHELGFDLFTESMDLTIQASKEGQESGVIILTATPVVDQTVDYIERKETSYRLMNVDGYDLRTWHDQKRDGPLYLHMTETERGTRRRAVLSSSLSRLLLTLKTMEGKAPDISHVEDSRMHVAPRDGSLLFFQTASVASLPSVDLDERITEAAGRVTFEASEHDDISRLDLSCQADSPQRAQTISEILQGLIAVGKLISSEDDDLEMLHHVLLAIRSEAHDSSVAISFAVPSEELEKMMPDDDDDWHFEQQGEDEQ